MARSVAVSFLAESPAGAGEFGRSDTRAFGYADGLGARRVRERWSTPYASGRTTPARCGVLGTSAGSGDGVVQLHRRGAASRVPGIQARQPSTSCRPRACPQHSSPSVSTSPDMVSCRGDRLPYFKRRNQGVHGFMACKKGRFRHSDKTIAANRRHMLRVLKPSVDGRWSIYVVGQPYPPFALWCGRLTN